MHVCGHGYGGLGGDNDGGGEWYTCGTKPRGLVICWELLGHFLSARLCTDDPRLHRRPGAQLWAELS